MKCCIEGCDQTAEFEVILYDLYEGNVSFEQDVTCPYLCSEHADENANKSVGIRETGGFIEYPYTNRHKTQGFTIYRPI